MASIMEEASIVVVERGKVYGSPLRNMTRIADLWSAYMGWNVEPHQVAICMELVKISRLAETPSHRDSIIDSHGYLAVYAECINEEDKEN